MAEASWLDLLPPALVRNLTAIATASDPAGVALDCAMEDQRSAHLYALLAEEVLRRRTEVAA